MCSSPLTCARCEGAEGVQGNSKAQQRVVFSGDTPEQCRRKPMVQAPDAL